MTHIEKMRLQAALKELQGKQRSITLPVVGQLTLSRFAAGDGQVAGTE